MASGNTSTGDVATPIKRAQTKPSVQCSITMSPICFTREIREKVALHAYPVGKSPSFSTYLPHRSISILIFRDLYWIARIWRELLFFGLIMYLHILILIVIGVTFRGAFNWSNWRLHSSPSFIRPSFEETNKTNHFHATSTTKEALGVLSSGLNEGTVLWGIPVATCCIGTWENDHAKEISTMLGNTHLSIECEHVAAAVLSHVT